MCGIAGIIDLKQRPIGGLERKLKVMTDLLNHRGPDGRGAWLSKNKNVGLIHTRLSIIDPTPAGHQPMAGPNHTVISFNGEICNYLELKKQFTGWSFRSQTDTEVILAAYEKYGTSALDSLRGMFAFALWDERSKTLFCARDRFGIKPLYYTVVNEVFYFASEVKALLPFVDEIETDHESLNEYFTLQNPLAERTLFKGINRLLPAHYLTIRAGKIAISRYWDVDYKIDFDHSEQHFHEKLRELLEDSVSLHKISDVPLGCYLSGGIDSSLVSLLMNSSGKSHKAFHGNFLEYPGYDESPYAKIAAEAGELDLHIRSMTHKDFIDSIDRIVYHLDYPAAGPGAVPQYIVSGLAAKHVKVVLAGQGGDELFGGYARYLIAYFEQCIRAAIEGNYKSGNFVVTAESIIPNLETLKEYIPLMKNFFGAGMFDSLDKRYFRLVDRFADVKDEIKSELFDRDKVFKDFLTMFNSVRSHRQESYFDSMTHYDFKVLLPALLHVEDRMSMAHGLESRVPFLDHPLVEFAATIPADIKFKDGKLKLMLKKAYRDLLPEAIAARRDKVGFAVPLAEWFGGPLQSYLHDTFNSTKARQRYYINTDKVLESIKRPEKFSRKIWGMLNLELWQQQFHDKASFYRDLARQDRAA